MPAQAISLLDRSIIEVASTYLEEFLIPSAAIENLLDENLFVRIFKLFQRTYRTVSTLRMGNYLTSLMNSSAWESMVLITGLKVLMHSMQCSIRSENFILFKLLTD
jgi:hypothetical protein